MLKQETIEFIKEKFSRFQVIQPRSFYLLTDEIKKELEKEVSLVPEYENIRNLVYCIAKGVELKHCPACGKLMKFSRSYILSSKTTYCCKKCADSSPDVLAHRQNTMMKRYGAANAMQSKEIQEKSKNTNLIKYGVDNPAKSKEIKDRIAQTNLDKYGSKCSLQGKEVIKKSKQTCIERYGHEFSTQSPEVNRKRHDACIAKYGVGNVMQNDNVKNRLKRTVFKKEYQKLQERWKDYVIPLFNEDEYEGQDKVYRWKCVKCGNEFESYIYSTNFNKNDWGTPRCLSCHPFLRNCSYNEKEILDFVKSIYNGEISENDRSLIHPFEIDIYIPERKIAIEYNGDFWHTEGQGKDEKYHVGKTESCLEKGVQLIHIFEHEWNDRKSIVKDRIKSLLGIYDRKIYARKCLVKEIDSRTSNDFLDENHLQGGDNSPIRYGLYYHDELVSVMTFGKPRFNENYDWELVRFASALGTQVIGAASKLLSFFRKSNPGSIISYADICHSNGELYRKIGFTQIGKSKPNYIWCNGANRVFSRYQCQKHKLPALLGDKFDPALSETENMEANGYFKLYDCGNYVFAMEN